MAQQTTQRRARRRGTGPAAGQASPAPAVAPGQVGGVYRPLGDRDMERIHATALDVLENIGMADPIPELRELALARGWSKTSSPAHRATSSALGVIRNTICT